MGFSLFLMLSTKVAKNPLMKRVSVHLFRPLFNWETYLLLGVVLWSMWTYGWSVRCEDWLWFLRYWCGGWPSVDVHHCRFEESLPPVSFYECDLWQCELRAFVIETLTGIGSWFWDLCFFGGWDWGLPHLRKRNVERLLCTLLFLLDERRNSWLLIHRCRLPPDVHCHGPSWMIRISGSVGLFSSWMIIERADRIEGKDHMVGISGSVGLFSTWMMFERADRIEGKDPRLWLGLRAFVHI